VSLILLLPEANLVIDEIESRLVIESHFEPEVREIVSELHFVNVLKHATYITELSFSRLNVAVYVRDVDVIHHIFDSAPVTTSHLFETAQRLN
jgi:hypothetical protein